MTLCGKDKCAVKKRPYAPGAHGNTNANSTKRRSRISAYGLQLREKQKAKRFYNVMEKQFRNYFAKALNQQGNTGENLVIMLEQRLDNVVYRLGFGLTRAQARQLVNHGFITVNDGVVDIASYNVRIGDIIRIKDNKKEKGVFQELEARLLNQDTPQWIHLDSQARTGKILSHPDGDDLKQIFDPTLIVELYSR